MNTKMTSRASHVGGSAPLVPVEQGQEDEATLSLRQSVPLSVPAGGSDFGRFELETGEGNRTYLCMDVRGEQGRGSDAYHAQITSFMCDTQAPTSASELSTLRLFDPHGEPLGLPAATLGAPTWGELRARWEFFGSVEQCAQEAVYVLELVKGASQKGEALVGNEVLNYLANRKGWGIHGDGSPHKSEPRDGLPKDLFRLNRLPEGQYTWVGAEGREVELSKAFAIPMPEVRSVADPSVPLFTKQDADRLLVWLIQANQPLRQNGHGKKFYTMRIAFTPRPYLEKLASERPEVGLLGGESVTLRAEQLCRAISPRIGARGGCAWSDHRDLDDASEIHLLIPSDGPVFGKLESTEAFQDVLQRILQEPIDTYDEVALRARRDGLSMTRQIWKELDEPEGNHALWLHREVKVYVGSGCPDLDHYAPGCPKVEKVITKVPGGIAALTAWIVDRHEGEFPPLADPLGSRPSDDAPESRRAELSPFQGVLWGGPVEEAKTRLGEMENRFTPMEYNRLREAVNRKVDKHDAAEVREAMTYWSTDRLISDPASESVLKVLRDHAWKPLVSAQDHLEVLEDLIEAETEVLPSGRESLRQHLFEGVPFLRLVGLRDALTEALEQEAEAKGMINRKRGGSRDVLNWGD